MPRSKNPRKIWFYSNEFKIKAIKLSYQPDIQSKTVAGRLGVQSNLLKKDKLQPILLLNQQYKSLS